MNDIIQTIVKFTDDIFPNSTFRLERKEFGLYKISGDSMSDAVNNFKNRKESIKVLKWFDDFWLYLEIRFVKIETDYKNLEKEKRIDFQKWLNEQFLNIEDDFFQTFISLSVFQGDEADVVKNQLFRAEWDTHEDNVYNPQPHWHIFPLKYGHKLFEDFEAFMDLYKEQGFEESLKDSTEKLIDISKFHFAMAGYWTFDNINHSHIHPINESRIISNWIPGLLNHIKEQLEYVK